MVRTGVLDISSTTMVWTNNEHYNLSTVFSITLVSNQVYHVGSEAGWSDLYTFSAMKSGVDWSPSFAIYGDMGNVNARSLARLQEETQKGHFDAILHVGTFFYRLLSVYWSLLSEHMVVNYIIHLSVCIGFQTCSCYCCYACNILNGCPYFQFNWSSVLSFYQMLLTGRWYFRYS